MFFGAPSMIVQERRTNYTYHIPINLTRKTDIGETEVSYRTTLFRNDTAREDEDYEGFISQSIVFKSVQTMAYGYLSILPDNDDNESYETLHIELIPRPHYRLGYPSTIKITIDSYKGTCSLLYCSRSLYLVFITVLSFFSNSTAVNETASVFPIEVSRTGSLDYKMIVPSELFDSLKLFSKNSDIHCTGEYRSLVFYENIEFRANRSNETTFGIIHDNDVYDGPRTVQYCLVSPENKTDIRFRHQCIDITVYDEEDCK